MILQLTFVVCVSLFHDVPLEISKETTYITGPLTKDGRVDYFRALELQRYPKNMKTDENGYRILVRKLGPFVDKDSPDAKTLAKQAYEKLGLDPATKPTMTYEEPITFLGRYVKSQDKGEKETEDEDEWDLYDKTNHPWTLKTMPMMADWLKKNGPALDVIAKAVRQPEFHRPITRVDDQRNLIESLLPDIQLIRSFARGLAARANYRIGTGDIDGTIDDIITMKTLGRQVGHQGTLVDALVGIAIEGIANAINPAGSPKHQPTKAQLKRLVKEIQNLPPRTTFEKAMVAERYFGLDILQSLARGKMVSDELFYFAFDCPHPKQVIKMYRHIGFDWNIVMRRANWYYDNIGRVDLRAQERLLKASIATSGFLSLEIRSEMLANLIGILTLPALEPAQEAFRRTECSDRLQRITLAMLLYEKDHGRLPPAYTVGKNRKPLHSWRVLLLPHLGKEAKKLHDKIKLDEPWDSPHNSQFHSAAVKFYQCPSAKLEPGQTTYSVVVGKKTAFQPGKGKKLDQLGPESGTMVLVIENHTPCNWMDPISDLTEMNAKEVLQMGSVHPGIIMTGLRGSGVSCIREELDSEKFQKGLEGTGRGWLDDKY